MTGIIVGVVVVAAIVVVAVLALSPRWLQRDRRVGDVEICNLHDRTSTDSSGAVRSVQAADMLLPDEALDAIWTPMHLERLARTYWRFLSRVTLGLVRVDYTDTERFVVLVARPLKLIAFRAPEYEMDERRGLVRWRIERGLLVARQGRGGRGDLQIDVARRPTDVPGRSCLHVEIEVANFYPAIAFGISRWLYNVTQSRIHVIVCNGFLRSLAKLDLAESRVGRFEGVDEVPEPAPQVAPEPAPQPLDEPPGEPPARLQRGLAGRG